VPRLPQRASGLHKAAAALTEAGSGLTQAEAGLRAMAAIQQVADGLSGSTGGYRQLSGALTLVENSLTQALAQLDAMQPASKADPQYPPIYRSVAGAQAIVGLSQIAGASTRIADGINTATQGLQQISTEIGKAAQGLQTAGEQGSAVDLKPLVTRGDMGLRLVAGGAGPNCRS
jgi:uncharacterized phage infection (PIP) family protein YhgE